MPGPPALPEVTDELPEALERRHADPNLIALIRELRTLRRVVGACEASLWDGADPEAASAIAGTLMASGSEFCLGGGQDTQTATLIIQTPAGPLEAERDDWLVRAFPNRISVIRGDSSG